MKTKNLGRFQISAWAMYSAERWIGYWQVNATDSWERTAVCSTDDDARSEKEAVHSAFLIAIGHCAISMELSAAARARRIKRTF
jgi:hypothetical protein